MSDKTDYRKTLNTILDAFYQNNGPYQIKLEEYHNSTGILGVDIQRSIDLLVKDGYISIFMTGNLFPMCQITAKGKIFLEQGGYQDNTTKFETIIKWAKNNSFLAWTLIVFVVASALIGFAVSLIAIYEFIKQ